MAREASGARSVAVAGDVRSSIIITGDNVDLQVRLDDVDGALLERLAERAAPEPVALPRPLDSRPLRYANHVDREGEAAAALAGAREAGAVNVYGEPGIGKTHLLSNAAHRPEADELPDGVVSVPTDGAALDDVLQALFEEFYDCGEPPVRPSGPRLRRSLRDYEALVVVDGLELEREAGQALVAAAPRCRFVAASTERCLWDAQAIRLEGLEPEFALALVEQELGRALAPGERLDAESLCRSLGGHPWRVREAVSRARDQGRTLAEAARSLDPGAPLEALTSGERSVLAALAAVGGCPVGLDRLRELAPVEDVEGTLADLERRHLVESHSPRYSLAEPLLAEVERRADLEPVREHALAQFLNWAERNRDEPDALARERPALLSLLRWAGASRRDADAIRLGRAVDPAFAGTGRFGSWGESIDVVLRAARASRDLYAEGWALHQRGTRAATLNEGEAGTADLEEALELRERIGDDRGAAVTRHNLAVLRGPPPWYAKLGWGPLTVLAVAIVLLAAAAGGALAYRELSDDEEVTSTTTTEPDGTVLVTVPGVVGDPVQDARAELEAAGLVVDANRTPSEDEPEGIVLEQDPEEGAEVEEGSLVALVVSSGPEQVEVPDVVGDPVEAATGELEGDGFEVSRTDAPPSPEVPPGIVTAQSPDGGALADPGSTVEITVSTATPPDLTVEITDFTSSCEGFEPPCSTMFFVVRTVNDVALPPSIPVRIVVFPAGSDAVEVPSDPLEVDEEGVTEETFSREIPCQVPGCSVTVEVDPDEILSDPNYRNNTDDTVIVE